VFGATDFEAVGGGVAWRDACEARGVEWAWERREAGWGGEETVMLRSEASGAVVGEVVEPEVGGRVEEMQQPCDGCGG
jgi:hypothetical protein